jgi:hypothetical protein
METGFCVLYSLVSNNEPHYRKSRDNMTVPTKAATQPDEQYGTEPGINCSLSS